METRALRGGQRLLAAPDQLVAPVPAQDRFGRLEMPAPLRAIAPARLRQRQQRLDARRCSWKAG